MRILLTNDDGYDAPGIQALADHLSKNHEIYIVAPDRERSATGHAITIHSPLRVEVINESRGIKGWKVNGTPTDCIKMAYEALLNSDKPELVLSGINEGPNLGTDILYSGTVAAAFEGWLYGCPAFAVSLYEGKRRAYHTAAEFIEQLIYKLSEYRLLQENPLLNINFPEGFQETKGVKVTELGLRRYENIFEKRTDPRGKSYYWLAGDVVDDHENENSDILAVKTGWVSVTPLKINLTDYDLGERLKETKLDDCL